MDVIASGAEACPWGLNGYGFEPYIAATPGNAVMALANFWADNVQTTLMAEEHFPDRCFRLRYEDLVADPEDTAAKLFEFLGEPAAPGISEMCFSAERERFGPADHKIWYTSKISSESVGRGWSVPTGMIAPPLLAVINELAGKLGYLAVDDDWGTTEPPADLRVPVTLSPADPDRDEAADTDGGPAGTGSSRTEPAPRQAVPRQKSVVAIIDGPPRSERLADQLRAGLVAAGRDVAERWGEHGRESFVAIAVTRDDKQQAEYWQVDLGEASVTLVTKEAQEHSDWDIIGPVEAWEQVLDHRVNLSVALRSCALRYCDNGNIAPVAADTRITIIAYLLGLTNWP
jgi:hypothetical protein